VIGVSSGVGVKIRIKIRIKITSACLGADCFAFGELLGKAPQVTKGACSWLGPSFVGVPSLRPCSVGPRRTDIHVLTALSPHPCGSAHCARPAFSLHPSRVWRCLGFLCWKSRADPEQIKSRSRADQEQIKSRSRADQEQIKGFPAEAGPTGCLECVIVPVPSVREEAGVSSLVISASPSLLATPVYWLHAEFVWDRLQPERGRHGTLGDGA
jgi:hypothetical protein